MSAAAHAFSLLDYAQNPMAKQRSDCHSLSRFARSESGSIVIKFSLMLPVLLAGVGLAIDLGLAELQKSKLQNAADAGAIAGAKSLSLSDANRGTVGAVVSSVVTAYVEQAAGGSSDKTLLVTTMVVEAPYQVEVVVSRTHKFLFGEIAGLATSTAEMSVASTARILGHPNICVLALDGHAAGALSLESNSYVQGNDCAVYSNSTNSNSIKSKDGATLRAQFICSAGGRMGGKGNFDPEPLLDCPGFEDPLADRPEPAVGGCDHDNLTISSGSTTLSPGTYCGGLTLNNGAEARLDPGTYVMKDGPLDLSEGATLVGMEVGFFFTGKGAVLKIDTATTIHLEGPTTGDMAGLLFFESRSQPESGKHTLLSDNAGKVVGTIYLSRGRLWVGGSANVGGEAAYTAIVTRVLEMTEGPRIILNTNYDQTGVPVPTGIRGAGQPVALVK